VSSVVINKIFIYLYDQIACVLGVIGLKISKD